MTAAAVAGVTAMAESYATLAYAVSGPVRLLNEQLAVDINRSQFRRALSTVRKATRGGVPEVRQQFRDLVGQAFAAKLDGLIRESDRLRGATPAFEVIGGLWVSKGRKPWEPRPLALPHNARSGRCPGLDGTRRDHALRDEARDPRPVRRGPGCAAGSERLAEHCG